MVQLSNGLEIAMAHYAIIKLGGIVVPLNVMYVTHEISYIGADTGAKAIILDSAFLPVLEEVRPHLPELRHVVVVGESAPEGAWPFNK